jgi:nitrogen regulatory protein PII
LDASQNAGPGYRARPVRDVGAGDGDRGCLRGRVGPLQRGPGVDEVKMVAAYIRHEAFEPIRSDLLELGFPSLSITEVKGSGRQKGITENYRGATVTNYLRPKVKLECVVADGDVQTIIDAILRHARTGAVGDGKVFVIPVEQSYRIRTGEVGEDTLQIHPDAAAAHG